MGCIFCAIADGKAPANIIYRDEHVVAFRDLHPVAPSHVLVIPRKHVTDLLHVGPEDRESLGHLMSVIPTIAREAGLDGPGFRLVSNCKEDAGQSVWHLHFHLMGGRRFSWPPG